MRRGPNVVLDVPRSADRADFLALVRASRAFHRGRAMPPSTPESFARYLARTRRTDHAALVVRRQSDMVLIGALELSQIVRGRFHSAYLGYWVGAPYAGQGFMTEAVGLALAHAFGSLRLHRIEANVQPDNAASLAIVRRLGFTREGYSRRYLRLGGRWRDHERWAILREDWRARRAAPHRRERAT